MSDSGELPKTVDLEALGIDHMAQFARAATFAPNWKMVLLVDALVGVAIAVAGVIISVVLHWVGWVLVAIGVVYVALVIRRGLQWRWLRQRAGF